MLKSPTKPGEYISSAYNISQDQIDVLEKQFLKLKTLHNTDLELLAAEMGLQEKDVQAWYTQRIAAWRREQGLSDCFGQL